ncbi:tyrosine-protein phosphatase [Microbacterium sediminicola]|uniref:tyrosine-protein phosphatase n=1 Tax=Microbacterium sediminicola TaxID=415210 RepID=UPI0031D776AB
MSTIEIPGSVNFRDVGGLPAGTAATRAGVLYRSGNLAGLDTAGERSFAALGIRRVIDLRDEQEVANAPSRIDQTAAITQHEPLFLGSVASFFHEDIPLAELYRRLVEDSAPRVVEVVRGIITDQPVLVHCTVGKDRTGVTVAVTLAAAGVDRTAVVDDYARTESLLPDARNQDVLARLRRHFPDAVHLEDLATRSPAPVMQALLADIDARYGSVSDYLRANGMSDDELSELRAVLIAR